MADNIAARKQEEAPEGMATGLISKQIKSRPIIYSKRVQGHMGLADSPIYQETRKQGKQGIRNMHKPPQGGDKCESGVAGGSLKGYNAGEEEKSEAEMDVERQ
eukprot:6179292-Pleurochrysis_carterae.AAC.4